MDPQYQQALLNEVIYLHSLYHHGPPPSSSSQQTPLTNLHISNHTHFKKPKSKKPKKPHKQKLHFSGKEWPVKPPVDPSPVTTSGWPELKLKPKSEKAYRPTKEELELHNWNQIQAKAVNKIKDFYDVSNGDDDVSSDEMCDDDDVSDEDDDEGDKEDGFYLGLFDDELKGEYVKYCYGGYVGCEYVCLVCGAVGENHRKRYKDCVGLVQHALSVGKTKRRKGHRVFGKVVCKVLGWDIDRLPSSDVLDCKNGELKGNDVNADKDVVNIAACDVGSNENMDNGNLDGKDHDVTDTIVDESMVCEDSLAVESVEEENSRNQVMNETEGNTLCCQQSLQKLVIENGAESSSGKKVDDKE